MTTLAETTRTRAKPLSSEDRRETIIDAVIPLIREHGRYVTTKQIAEAAGIAEGTIFRVFADKEAVIEAAVDKFLDPAPLHRGLRAIDPQLPLEAKVNDILFQMHSRMTGIMGMMQAIGMAGPPPRRQAPDTFTEIITEVLTPNLEQLELPPDRVASFIRLVSFASAIPHFNAGREIDTADLARLITYGIVGAPAEGESTDAA
ncbi:MAG TPA: helix-turn-helix domain-containing protein [Galbitalea sp.]|nr:helix-turn-helix domain-containing protein [Galbitalea sp.]